MPYILAVSASNLRPRCASTVVLKSAFQRRRLQGRRAGGGREVAQAGEKDAGGQAGIEGLTAGASLQACAALHVPCEAAPAPVGAAFSTIHQPGSEQAAHALPLASQVSSSQQGNQAHVLTPGPSPLTSGWTSR